MFVPFTAIMAALSASTPFLKGKISAHDLRWEVIEQSVDCRTKEERDPENCKHIRKSRYSTVSRYISNHEYVQDFHNDFLLRKTGEGRDACGDCLFCKEYLMSHNIDKRLCQHIGNIFIRAPVPAYEKEFMFPCCGH
jgi:glutamate--cysteine ligase catalytic subunit